VKSSCWVKVVAFLLLFAPFAKGAERQVLHGHVPEAAKRLQPLKRLPSTNRVELSISLPLRNGSALSNLLAGIYDPSNPNYHQYLTPEQFAKRFGPVERDYDALMAFAKNHNLTITGMHPNRTLLDLSGAVGDIEKAFHLNMRVYQHPKEARTFRAPDVEPSLDLAVPVLSISGLDDFNLPRPMTAKFQKVLDSRTKVRRPVPSAPLGAPIPYATGSGPRATFIGKDFRTAYAPGVSLDGAGQAIGLFELDGYFPSDITEYEKLAGLPNVPITNVLVNGFSGRAGNGNLEAALDIEMTISMAPGLLKVIVYEGTGANANAILNRMATDNLAKQLSSSWGFGSQVDPAREQIFQQFAAQGQSMFQASGDVGAWTGDIFPPSDDAWVTVVGGTSLNTITSGGAWQSESTWSGSGGGVSTSYTIPIWQQGIDMAANQGSTTMRNIPDVAAHADNNIWVIVNNGEQGITGGTSAAAPLWTAFAALANQQAAANGQPSIGFLNPALYAIGKGPTYSTNFHDISTGNNTNSDSLTKFFASPGFDLCTGWGTPNGSNLLASLVTPPDTLRITPSANFLASGPAGGPFTMSVQSYALTNFGSAPVNWSLVNTSAWLNASVGGGTLLAGAPGTNVILTLNSAASNLVAGSYSTTLLFSNLTDQTVQSRQFTLAIVAPPVITSQPVSQAVMEGATVTLSVGTASNALLYYQWRQDNGIDQTNLTDGGNFLGSATSTLTISNSSAANVGVYSVLVSNAAGVAVSSNASLTILPSPPVIVAQPKSRIALAGETVTFVVGANGSKPLSFRWRRGGTNLSDDGNISGATSSLLTVGNVSPADVATYSVIITNTHGSTVSSKARLLVISSTAPDATLSRLYSFSGGNDGANPNGLVLATNGALYGTTQNGGTNGLGTIFQLGPDGTPVPAYSLSGSHDGANPFASLTQGADGNFYGTAFQGGAFDNGTIFKITPAGAFTNLISLNITNGDLPYAGLILAADGNYYGATYQGGASGRGTIFKITPSGLLTTIYSFSGGTSDGGFPHASLVQADDGNLYGTTHKGGAFDFGTVFRITTNGTFKTLVSFNNTNGASSYASLARGEAGNLYGTTAFGGSHSNGTIFKISPSGQFTNIYSFIGSNDGAHPIAALFAASDGNLYGTTANGGAYGRGTVFRLLPNGTITSLVHFNGSGGASPQAPLADGPDGNLYGTTQYGGADGQGTIFRLSFNSPPQIVVPPTNQTVFAGANISMSVAVTGSRPLFYQWKENGTNLIDGGNVSGSATRILSFNNITTNNAGTYSVLVSNALGWVQTVDAILSVTASPPIIVSQPTNQNISPAGTAIFSVNAIGNQPLSYQWRSNGFDLADGGNVSGSTSSALTILSATEGNNATYSVLVTNALGSTTSTGAVLTVIPASAAGTRLATLFSFSGNNDGGTPNALALGTNGLLYGTTQLGGALHQGTVFSVGTNGAVTAPLVSFAGTNGSLPRAGLAQGADGNLYGTTQVGGTNSAGNVFRMSLTGVLSNLYSFSDPVDGSNPYAPLVQANDGNLYGFTTSGGSNSYGNTFRINPNGTLTPLYSFTNGSDGTGPVSALIQASDGNLYGVTAGGGSAKKGSVFRLAADGRPINLYSFSGGQDGLTPNTLVQGGDGILYGTTTHSTIGPFQFYGTIFKITTNGQFGTLYTLNTADGHYPNAGLVQASDGNFYGTTYNGGAFGSGLGNGTVFRIAPNGTFITLASFDGFNDGANPAAALVQGPDGALYGTTTTGGWNGRGTVFRLAYTSVPQIVTQPLNQITSIGGSAAFSVTVTGANPLYYQWQRNGTDLVNGANVSGSTGRILTLTNITIADAGTYSIVVSNSFGSTPSSGALLTVLFPPVFQTATKSNNSFVLSWSAAQGQKYQLQYKTNLNSTNWFNLGSAITASGGTVSASDLIGSNAQRFYRVILLP
jgi:uncharacterized repeat protein (TIGR03803 family)